MIREEDEVGERLGNNEIAMKEMGKKREERKGKKREDRKGKKREERKEKVEAEVGREGVRG